MRLKSKMENNETHIIRRILKGETALYENFLNQYGQQVFSLIARIICNQEDAEELTQDVFLKAFQHLSSFKAESSFSTWIYSIAYNTAISAARKRKFDTFAMDDTLLANISEQQVDEYLTLDTTELLLKHEKMLCIILGVDVAQDSKIPLIENPVERLQMIFKEHFYKKESESGYEKVMQYIIKDTALSAAQIEQLRKAVEAKMPSEDVLEMAQNRKDVMEIRRCIEFYEMMRQKEESKDKSKKSRRDSR